MPQPDQTPGYAPLAHGHTWGVDEYRVTRCTGCGLSRSLYEARRREMDPYTVQMRLCDDAGMVSSAAVAEARVGVGRPGDATYLARHNRLRNMSRAARGDKPETTAEPFACTGSAHLAGEHIQCTSPAHKPGPKPPPIAPGDTARYA